MGFQETLERSHSATDPETRVVEVNLALPAWLFRDLQKAASDHGLTAAQLLRLLAGQFLAGTREKRGVHAQAK